MGSPLDGLRAKLGRADEHLHTLDEEVRAFLDTEPYRVRHENDSETGQRIARVEVIGMPPLVEWGLIVGDCVSNMRSALDHLAWALAAPDPPERTEFPIFHDRDKFEGADRGGGLYKIRGIREAGGRRVIESVQPCYERTKYVRSHPLYVLQELSNEDKHRILLLGDPLFTGVVPPAEEEGLIDTIWLKVGEDGTEIVRYKGSGGTPEEGVAYAFDVALIARLPEPGASGTATLHRIRDYIESEIVKPMEAIQGA